MALNPFNPVQPSIAFNIETSGLICSVNQMTGFYMKYKTGVKWVNWFQIMNQGYQPGRGIPIYTFFILSTAWNVFVFGYSLVRIFPHSGWIREGKYQKNSKYGHFLRSVAKLKISKWSSRKIINAWSGKELNINYCRNFQDKLSLKAQGVRSINDI